MAAKVTDVADKAFDYLIIGGGTAGLTIAARLTEDPSISVAVLEAGQSNLDDPKILEPALFGSMFADPKYDWTFMTVPQKNSNNKVDSWNRGKGLGGSSSINFYCWIKPPRDDIDAIEKLGNPGWCWDDFMKYSLLSEKFHDAGKDYSIYPQTPNPKYHGTTGPVHTSTPYPVHGINLLFQQTFINKGCNVVVDPYGGDVNGTWMSTATMDPKTWTRSYATTAHYQPNKDRSNLTVLTEALVSRILFDDCDVGKDVTATGVEFIHDGQTYKVMATKEVVLSAGAIKSPQILELSGIGRAEILSKIDVDMKVELPGVGENVQEHIGVDIFVELNSSVENEMQAEDKGLFRTGVKSFAFIPLSTVDPKGTPGLVERLANKIDVAKKNGTLPPGLAEQFDIQLETLKNDRIPDVEFLAFPPPKRYYEPGNIHLNVNCILQHPFSRGYIHAKSKDPNEQPEINPNNFDWDIDLEALVQQVKYVRSLSDVEPWKSAVCHEVSPGPECKTDEQIREFVKNNHVAAWHTVGSCSMLPRDKQGVVDPKLKVYGTTNLRVADISIVPIHLATHTQSIAYMIGEKASDIIKGKYRA